MACIATRARLLVLHGSLTTFRRRCGKASCRCASGDAHESPAFTYPKRTHIYARRPTVEIHGRDVQTSAAALEGEAVHPRLVREQVRRLELVPTTCPRQRRHQTCSIL